MTTEKLMFPDFLFLGTTHYSSFFPHGFKCRRWFQPPNSSLLHACLSACLDQRYFYSINHCPHRFIDDTFIEMETHSASESRGDGCSYSKVNTLPPLQHAHYWFLNWSNLCLEDLLATSLSPLDETTDVSVEGQGEKEKNSAQLPLLQQ